MTEPGTSKWRWRIAGLILGIAAVWGVYVKARPADEVVLTIGEPYKQVRQQSRSTLPVLTGDNRINLHIQRPAVLRFSDPQYGFSTPAAKFLSLYADDSGKVVAVTLSPQLDTLPLDEAMAVFIGLQDQFRRGGWKPFRVNRNPPIEDTRDTRAQIRRCVAPTSYWQAGNTYQISLNIRCFRSDDRPNDERYLITLDLGLPVFGELPNDQE
ncbi:flagellar biosynthesis sigma factor [Paraburkholderia sp. RL17-337-BIB-A]|uniref:flagellar biosynthesis sigma factor n=1 Tax=Paraburkholderia sp. RL17-337-BIB-A TaxID=3031636 RepID=UPI0038BAF79B